MQQSLDTAMEIYSHLMMGDEIRSSGPLHRLYEACHEQPEVYDCLSELLKTLNLRMYDWDGGLHMTAGTGNDVFGYSNEALRKELALRTNTELYMCFYIIYEAMLAFYSDSGSFQFTESITLEQLTDKVDRGLSVITDELPALNRDDISETSFKSLAALWENLPLGAPDETGLIRASRGSRTGIVKLTANFLCSQDLFMQAEGRYYPTDRFKALCTSYFEENRGQLYSLLKGDDGNAAD